MANIVLDPLVKGATEPFTSRLGAKINNWLDFKDNKEDLERHFKALTSKADDIEVKLKNAELSGVVSRKLEVKNWFEEVEKFKMEYDRLNHKLSKARPSKSLRYGDRVKKLKDGAEELIKRGDKFNVGELVVDAYATTRERSFNAKLHGEELKKELDSILEWIMTESDQVPCTGIYGMGGVGKTTLANHVFNNLQYAHDKLYVYWVTVSQEADVNKMQHDLARELNLSLPKDDDLEVKAAILKNLLREKKNVVLIFDDVWKYFDVRAIGIPLELDGCKVIITSRSRDVCSQMHCKKVVKVEPLSEEEAWGLFLEKLEYGNNELSPEVEEVARKMANKCDGLPLAIITVARSMMGVEDVHEWRDAFEELKDSIMSRDEMKDEVLPILLYSYERLRDTRFKTCFLCCALYPEDWAIRRDELIELFISSGVMDRRGTRAAEFDQGHMILNKLVNSCLLESVLEYEVQCVKMHDLVREMAIEITRNNKPRYLIKAGLRLDKMPDEEEWGPDDLDKVSFMRNWISEIPEGSSPRYSRLSTLILRNNPLKLIPDSFFNGMRALRILNLRYTSIERLPNSISELENLTALLLGGCERLLQVPSLEKLKALMELDLSDTNIKKLPEGIECLVKLKYLNMRKMMKLAEIPSGLLSKFSRLQLLFLPFRRKVESKEIQSLNALEEFEGRIDPICRAKWFNKSPAFTCYRISSGGGNNQFDPEYRFSIELSGYTFKNREKDMQNMLPCNIQELIIASCTGFSSDCLVDVILSLSKFRDLAKLSIRGCEEIECMMRISSDNESTWANNNNNLECLDLLYLPNLTSVIEWEQRAPQLVVVSPPRGDAFSSLKRLSIYRCDKVKKLFPRSLLAHNFLNLEKICIDSCDQIEEIIAEDDEGVGSINNITTFPKLREIVLHLLPELESIYKGTINACCDSIEIIDIWKCHKLKRLPFFHHNQNASVASSSSSNNNDGTIIVSSFPKLEQLKLHDVPELKSICDGIMICDSIYSIDIRGCRDVRRLPLFLPRNSINGQPSPPPSLKLIIIRKEEREWWESLEWEHPNSSHVLGPLLSEYGY